LSLFISLMARLGRPEQFIFKVHYQSWEAEAALNLLHANIGYEIVT